MLHERQVKSLVHTTLKKKVPDLVEALNGRMKKHHRMMIQMHYNHLIYLENQIQNIEFEIDQLMEPYREYEELLITIPGIQKDAAAVILAEIGTDMSRFPTDAHLASWAGLSPANNESAGKKKAPRINAKIKA